MMNWINPFGSLWATPTYGGRFFSADCEAVYQTDKVGVRVQPPLQRFPSTAEGINRLLIELRRLSYLRDAVEDDMDIYGVHEALGLIHDLREVSVYEYEDLEGLAYDYVNDLIQVMGLLYMDLLRAWHSQSGAREAIETWSVVNNTTMEKLMGETDSDDIVSWLADTESWIKA
jgi:hypothetical protein